MRTPEEVMNYNHLHEDGTLLMELVKKSIAEAQKEAFNEAIELAAKQILPSTERTEILKLRK